MMMTSTVFLLLLTGHLLGDWVAQSDWQATNKTRSWAALAAHVAGYHLVMGALLLLPVVRDGWPAWKALAVLAVSAATHALIDRRWPVWALLRVAGSPGFATVEWSVVAVDQALHLSILAMLAVLLG
jgi:Protein of unknown function (DUF3307)